MNKYTLYFIFLICSSSAFSDQSEINIIAKVLDNTCYISTESSDFLVNMSTGNLTGMEIGIPFTVSPFSISIDNCPANVSVAHVKFTGDSDVVMPNLLKIASSSDSDAKGIAIGLYDHKNNNLSMLGNITDFNINHNIDRNTFYFNAAYLKTINDALPGKVVGVASFEISYD